MYARESCSTCHSINGSGGCIAPPLDAIGARRTSRFILSRITDTPEAIRSFEELYRMPELMPHLRVSEPTAKALTSYLMTLPAPTIGFKVGVHKVSSNNSIDTQQSSAVSPGEIEHGKRLFYERGCIACHSIGDIGGTFAPRLDGIKEHRDKKFVSTRISDAEFFVQKYPDEYGERGTLMTPSDLNEKDIRGITEYLMSLPKQK